MTKDDRMPMKNEVTENEIPEEALYSHLVRLQMTLDVHSWEELYECLKHLPFPDTPIEIRTTTPYINTRMRNTDRIDYSNYGADRGDTE